MITADELKEYIGLDRYSLSHVLAKSGYVGMSFKDVKFLGLTNGSDFCYSVKFYDESGEGEETGKVFVKKASDGKMVADY